MEDKQYKRCFSAPLPPEARGWGRSSRPKAPSRAALLLRDGCAAAEGEVPPPGGKTWRHFYQRAVNALHDILRATDAKKIIVATHSGVCTVLGLEALGLGYAGKRTFGNTNCGIHTIGIAMDHWYAVSFNDITHLPSA